jgi:hypothetical protein
MEEIEALLRYHRPPDLEQSWNDFFSISSAIDRHLNSGLRRVQSTMSCSNPPK